jgi:type I restriction enzyme S subunit
MPPTDIRRSFGDSVWHLLRPLPSIAVWNDRLAAMRDLLLPKLVTGQIDVSSLDLDAVVASVT